MKSTHTPRQERSRQTHEALLDAAEELGIEKTYEQISIQEIAAQAGFTSGAFYARFKSKRALLWALMDRYEAVVDSGRARLAAIESNDQLVAHVASLLVEAYKSDMGRMRLLESAVHADEALASKIEAIRRTILDFIIETLGRTYPLPRRDLETAALLLVMPLRELHFKREFWPEQSTSATALTECIVDAVSAFLNARSADAAKSAR